MYEIGHISTGVFCPQTQERQRYRSSCVNFYRRSRSNLGIVCRPRTPTTDIFAAHHRCSSTSQRANRRSIQSRKRLSKASCDVHWPRENRRRINAAQRSRVGYLFSLSPLALSVRYDSLADSAKTALQTVAAGQVSENLLDFDDEPATEQPTGLAATQVLQQPAAKNIMSGTSTNPLDDLVSIFGNTSLSPPSVSSQASPLSAPAGVVPAAALDPFGGLGVTAVASSSPASASALNQQEDLLGLF